MNNNFDPFSSFNNISNINLQQLFNLKDYSIEVKKHLINVYFTLIICLLSTLIGVYFTITYNIQLGNIFTFILSLGLVFWIQYDQKKHEYNRRLAMLCGFGFLQGISISPLIDIALYIDPTIVMTAVIGTITVFACFSAAALISQRRSFLFLGGIISSATSLLAILSLSNIFLRSPSIYNLQLYAGLMMFSGYVIFDTQLLLEKAENGSRDVIGHALDLYIDFIALLVRIIVVLLKNAEKKNEKKKNQR
mmetsp:Transcript_19609/g.20321  ORF Transcript_19609/g.20321 Transcript_19609/m.20321 type:complete len:249 (+) Transcript_19609:1112-1858(+)